MLYWYSATLTYKPFWLVWWIADVTLIEANVSIVNIANCVDHDEWWIRQYVDASE